MTEAICKRKNLKYLPILSELSIHYPANSISNLFLCFSGRHDLLHSKCYFQPQTSSFIPSTLSGWPCILLHREQEVIQLWEHSTQLLHTILQTSFLISTPIRSSSSKKLFLPNANYSYKQDPFYLLGIVSMIVFFSE